MYHCWVLQIYSTQKLSCIKNYYLIKQHKVCFPRKKELLNSRRFAIYARERSCCMLLALCDRVLNLGKCKELFFIFSTLHIHSVTYCLLSYEFSVRSLIRKAYLSNLRLRFCCNCCTIIHKLYELQN